MQPGCDESDMFRTFLETFGSLLLTYFAVQALLFGMSQVVSSEAYWHVFVPGQSVF